MRATNRQQNIVSPWSQVDKLGALPPEVDNEGNIEYKVSIHLNWKKQTLCLTDNSIAQTRQPIQ